MLLFVVTISMSTIFCAINIIFLRLFLTKGTHMGRANQKCNVPVLM